MNQERFATDNPRIMMAQTTINKHAHRLLHAIQAREALKGNYLTIAQRQRRLDSPGRILDKLEEHGPL